MQVDGGTHSAAAASAPTIGVKEKRAALETLVATLGSLSDPDAVSLKLSKEAEIQRLRAQLQADRPIRARLQVATEGRDRMWKVLQGHRQDIETLESFLAIKRDLTKQSEEELALRAAEVKVLDQEFQAELAQQLLPIPSTPPVALMQHQQQQPLSPAHWAAGFSASLPTAAAANFKAWM